ncbi:3680_t:CDS:2, partial [Gigaspora margarita]
STLNISEMIETHNIVAPINNRIRARKPSSNCSILNVSKIIKTQDIVALISNRIRAYKPNGNCKGAKKEKYVNCNASIDVDKSDSNLSEENIIAPISNRIRARKPKRNYIDHNVPINVDESNQRSAFDNSEMLEIQDITAPTIKKTKARRPNDNSKKRKHIDHTAPANIDDSDSTLLEKNIKLAKIQDTVASTNHKTKACKPNINDNSKKDHNALINDGYPSKLITLNVGEILDTQDTTARNNNRSNACKSNANSNSKKAKKRKHVDHNIFINVDDGDTTLSEKTI